MTPDYERAAAAAAETLIKNNICFGPVDPLPILKRIPGVLVLSYETVSNNVRMDRSCVISMFGDENQDAFSSVNIKDGKVQYLVTYNQRLPFHFIQRALARELGHIILGHDGSRPEEVRNQEAVCFANHLLCPRPVIRIIQEFGIRLTADVLVNLTGCYHHCLSCIRKLPPIHIPADLNRRVREQFTDYVSNYIDFELRHPPVEELALADLGVYMEGYEE